MSDKRQKDGGKELAELKRENGQLKRKVAKLQKQLQKALEGLFTEPNDEPSPEPQQKEKKPDGCPECGGTLKRVSAPTGTIVVCAACKWRKFKIEATNGTAEKNQDPQG